MDASPVETAGSEPPRVLVTGAGGFIGLRLCERLKLSGHQVVGLGRSERPGPWDDFLIWDIAASAQEIAFPKADTVFHLASKAHALSERPGEDSSYREVIVDGTRRVVAAAEAAGVRTFVFISTVKAMGEGQGTAFSDQPICEEDGCDPRTPYGASKLEAEQIVASSTIPHVVILRPTMVYGPGQKGNLVRMVEAVQRNRFPPLPETGNRRSMVHVDDLVDAALLAAHDKRANREALIITGDDPLSTRQLYDGIRAALALPPQDLAIPLWMLAAAATGGSLAGVVLRRRMPLDRDTLGKLIGSAWYSSGKAKQLISYCPTRTIQKYLDGLACELKAG